MPFQLIPVKGRFPGGLFGRVAKLLNVNFTEADDRLIALENSADNMKLVLRSRNDSVQLDGLAQGASDLVQFGTPEIEETNFVTLTGTGGTTITFITPGAYYIYLKFQIARSSAAQSSTIAFRSLYTPDGEAVQEGVPAAIELDNVETSVPFIRDGMLPVSINDQYEFEGGIESSNTDIELQPVPTPNLGWGTASSAVIEIFKLNQNGTSGINLFQV